MKKKITVAAITAVATLVGSTMVRTGDAVAQVTVYKSPSCGCCGAWIEHLEKRGFDVRAVNTQDMAQIKATHGIHSGLSSCHTALVDGYVVEGHVPADVIERMLTERPAIAGIAVPGMPVGSPGMEVPGQLPQRYEVLAFDPSGRTTVYARVN